MVKFIGGVVVGAILGLLVGAFRPNETKEGFRSTTDTVSSAIAKGATSAQVAADQQLTAPPAPTTAKK